MILLMGRCNLAQAAGYHLRLSKHSTVEACSTPLSFVSRRRKVTLWNGIPNKSVETECSYSSRGFRNLR
jgi:hypothetical protein